MSRALVNIGWTVLEGASKTSTSPYDKNVKLYLRQVDHLLVDQWLLFRHFHFTFWNLRFWFGLNLNFTNTDQSGKVNWAFSYQGHKENYISPPLHWIGLIFASNFPTERKQRHYSRELGKYLLITQFTHYTFTNKGFHLQTWINLCYFQYLSQCHILSRTASCPQPTCQTLCCTCHV